MNERAEIEHNPKVLWGAAAGDVNSRPEKPLLPIAENFAKPYRQTPIGDLATPMQSR
ncbi:hypothetical protein [Rhizobium sp. OAE497]|uniref:hypothetical protein n=1 Tax=Rhizobium sp. OAE497 TaxID=2663796 RepID=UPI0018F51419